MSLDNMSETPPRNLRGQGILGRASHSSSPFLRGGHALGHKVQALAVTGKGSDSEPGLARLASEKLGLSGTLVLPTFDDQVDGKIGSRVEALQQTIYRHEMKLEQMQSTVLRLQEATAAQKKTEEHYQRLLARQEKTVENTLYRTQLLLQEQSQILQTQEIFIRRLERQRNGGVLMSMAYMMISLYVVEMPLVDYVIQLISSPLMRRNRHARWVPHGVKILCVVQLVTIFRMLGSSLTWTDRVWVTLSGLLRKFGRTASGLLHLSRCPSGTPAVGNSSSSSSSGGRGMGVNHGSGNNRGTRSGTADSLQKDESGVGRGNGQSNQPDLSTT